MLTKFFAPNAIEFPAVGQGTGDNFWDSELPFEKKVALVRKGIDSGMNLIDTAEGYGDGLSERIVGDAISGTRDQVVVATKVSADHLAYEEVLDAADRSLKRLGIDRIDLYQVHWPNPSVPISETMAAFRVLLETGKIRLAGVCNFTQREATAAQTALGDIRLTSIQNEFNLLERTVEYTGLLDYCSHNELACIASSPLDLGRVTSVDGRGHTVLNSIALAHGRSIAQVALSWVTMQPGVVAIPGTTKEQHLIENSEATDFRLSDEEARQIDREFFNTIIYADTERIRMSLDGEFNHPVYQTLVDAVENKLEFAPSPLELAKGMELGDFLKPVHLVPSSDASFDYDLIGGRIRYWAWVIAHGNKTPIPAYVRK